MSEFFKGFVIAYMIFSFLVLLPLSVVIIMLWIKVRSMEESTHKIEYIDPLKQSFEEPTAEQIEKGLKPIDFKNLV